MTISATPMLAGAGRSMDEFLSGRRLFGDDFGPDEIRAWFEDEAEGYADLGARDFARYRYGYHALNRRHGIRYLPKRRFQHALGVGSAYGEELAPLAPQIDRITVLEPSDAFRRETIEGVPSQYVKPRIDGRLPFADGAFDLITCLGVLHHIPNVSFVVSEFHRCLAPGGCVLMREPIVSMGDWTRPRPGLTKRERGIPIGVFDAIVGRHPWKIVSRRFCVFRPLPKIWKTRRSSFRVFRPLAKIWTTRGGLLYNQPLAVWLDAVLSFAMQWNVRYHAQTAFGKLAPASIFYVLLK
jgi:SAM-dependent methyltransferase